MQSQNGLLGEIDEEKTYSGTIVCKDGFRATTVSGKQFTMLFKQLELDASIIEVDGSSIFCKVVKKNEGPETHQKLTAHSKANQ